MTERSGHKADSTPRKRALVSCDRCKLRRARCIRSSPNEPCSDCKASGVQCESKLPRKQRVYGSVETLSLRYRALESLVKGLFPQDNTQDTNVLFELAAAKNISMPATDDFTPAAIFNEQQPSGSKHQQHAQPSHLSSISPQTILNPSPSGETPPVATTARANQPNPFQEKQLPPRRKEELIRTRHGVPHYFGPSSTFRLATAVRELVGRYKAASGHPATLRKTSSSQSDTLAKPVSTSFQRSASDEEYTITGAENETAAAQEQRQRKRSRSQMEEMENELSHVRGSSKDTIGDFLPSKTVADALVLAYFDHIHVYFPMFHQSMFQFRLGEMYSRQKELVKDYPEPGWLVCLALVFSFGCQKLHEHDPDAAQKLRVRYLAFSKAYLRDLLTTTCLVNVQALVLLNTHHHIVGQMSSSWLIIGLAARMAITLGMHRDGPNAEFDPIERNVRRQVWWSIYVFEKILSSILGRPTVIDDREVSPKVADTFLLEQRTMSEEFMICSYRIVRLSFRIRQETYFDPVTAEERTPTIDSAEFLLRECDQYLMGLSPAMSIKFPLDPSENRATVLLHHIFYYYMRSIVSREFHVQKVERDIAHLEGKPPDVSEGWEKILALSEDCVESAHKSIQCTMAGAHLGMIEYSWLNLFFIFHSILIVCADFLARPREQYDTHKDTERKTMVRLMLNHVHGLKLAPTYNILHQIAVRFASITGVSEEPALLQGGPAVQSNELPQDPQSLWRGEGMSRVLAEMTDSGEDWFSSAATTLGLDFFDFGQIPDTHAAYTDFPPWSGFSMDSG